MTNKLLTGFISIVAVLVMAACSSDDDPETVTEMNSEEKAEVHLLSMCKAYRR